MINYEKFKNKKIMIACPLGRGTTKNGRDVANALTTHGLNVTLFDMDQRKIQHKLTPKPLRNHNYDRNRLDFINTEIVKSITLNKIDILFIIKPVGIYKETLQLINSMGVLTSAYWIDDPLDFSRSIINSKYFSICFTNDKHSLSEYKKNNVNICHLPSAVDTDCFYHLNTNKKYDISFIGTYAKIREQKLQQLKNDVFAFGPGWTKKTTGNKNIIPKAPVFGDKTALVYNQSIININIHMWHNIGSAMNLRLFEVPACKAFLLTDWVDEIDDYFTPGVNIEVWHDLDELNDKVSFYLKNNSAREKITNASYHHVLKNHTYINRCDIILNEIGKFM